MKREEGPAQPCQGQDPGDPAGCVATKDGRLVPFGDWYLERFGEEPTVENMRRRLAAGREERPC
jgi:hypothetical protein